MVWNTNLKAYLHNKCPPILAVCRNAWPCLSLFGTIDIKGHQHPRIVSLRRIYRQQPPRQRHAHHEFCGRSSKRSRFRQPPSNSILDAFIHVFLWWFFTSLPEQMLRRWWRNVKRFGWLHNLRRPYSSLPGDHAFIQLIPASCGRQGQYLYRCMVRPFIKDISGVCEASWWRWWWQRRRRKLLVFTRTHAADYGKFESSAVMYYYIGWREHSKNKQHFVPYTTGFRFSF